MTGQQQDCAAWLTEHGWDANRTRAPAAAARYGRPLTNGKLSPLHAAEFITAGQHRQPSS